MIRAHRLGNAQAEDAFQTTWLRLVESLDRIREPERLGAWLATTAKREALLAIRRSRREVPSAAIDDIELTDSQPQPIAGLVLAERDTALWRAFREISERCQDLLRLLMADPPISYAQIGEILEMPIGAIGPTRGRCLERLRAALARHGVSTAEAT